jgi:hypothetical protein
MAANATFLSPPDCSLVIEGGKENCSLLSFWEIEKSHDTESICSVLMIHDKEKAHRIKFRN